ncbi:MAG: inverse autotransporter beta domain-containing protein, partial [Deltaproteobacteria bacterium]|nr:inverse autotransporter beta domain-containing protein [Deltaproteobacteria bacterium]
MTASGSIPSGGRGNLDLTFKRGGEPAPEGSIVSMLRSADWPNLRDVPRELLPGGRIALWKLQAAGSPGRVPIEASVPGGGKVSAMVLVEESPESPGAAKLSEDFEGNQNTTDNERIGINLRSSKRGNPGQGSRADNGSRSQIGSRADNGRLPGNGGRRAGSYRAGTDAADGGTHNMHPPGGAAGNGGRAGRGGDGLEKLKSMAVSAGSDAAREAALGWLSEYGQARMELGLGARGGIGGSADFLYPFYDGEKATLFGQLGARVSGDGRTVANFGLGARLFPGGGSGLGANAFLDWDAGRGHGRIGAGAEYWRERFSLAANAYRPVTGWKASPDRPGADERPASGWDAKARGHLVKDGRLSASVGYESWKGSHVFGEGLYSDPSSASRSRGSWAYGLRLMPVPGLTLNAEYRNGAEKGFSGSVSYTVALDGTGGSGGAPSALAGGEGGTPFDPRSRRFDFVDRRYDMPLQYRASRGYAITMTGCAEGLCGFRVANSLGVPWAGAAAAARPASPGFSTADTSGAATESFVTDGDGRFSVKLVPEPGVSEGTLRVSAGDAEADFQVSFGAGPPAPAGTVRVIYVGPEPGNVHVFRVVDQDGRGVPGRRVGFSVGSGVPVADPESGLPRESFDSDGGGYIRIRLKSADPGEGECVVYAEPEGGEPGSFPVALERVLELAASPLELEYLAPVRVAFTPSLNGERLRAGTPVRFHSEGSEGDYDGLPEEAAADADGAIVAGALTALKEGALSPVTVSAGGLLSNPVAFSSSAKGGLELTADRGALEYLAPSPTVFTVKLNGVPLPAGVAVALAADDPSGLANLPAAPVTGPGGRIAADGLTALKPSGPLNVTARKGALESPPASFGVDLTGALTLSSSRGALELGSPVAVTLAVLYNGVPLPAGTAVGFAFGAGDLAGLPRSENVSGGGEVTAGLEALS